MNCGALAVVARAGQPAPARVVAAVVAALILSSSFLLRRLLLLKQLRLARVEAGDLPVAALAGMEGPRRL